MQMVSPLCEPFHESLNDVYMRIFLYSICKEMYFLYHEPSCAFLLMPLRKRPFCIFYKYKAFLQYVFFYDPSKHKVLKMICYNTCKLMIYQPKTSSKQYFGFFHWFLEVLNHLHCLYQKNHYPLILFLEFFLKSFWASSWISYQKFLHQHSLGL